MLLNKSEDPVLRQFLLCQFCCCWLQTAAIVPNPKIMGSYGKSMFIWKDFKSRVGWNMRNEQNIVIYNSFVLLWNNINPEICAITVISPCGSWIKNIYNLKKQFCIHMKYLPVLGKICPPFDHIVLYVDVGSVGCTSIQGLHPVHWTVENVTNVYTMGRSFHLKLRELVGTAKGLWFPVSIKCKLVAIRKISKCSWHL